MTASVETCRVLVTGAYGLIGRHACAALAAAGAAVLRPAGPSGERIDLLDVDTHARLMAETGPTHLLHLAWYTEHGKFWDSPLNERWEEASASLFSAFYDAGGRRAVGAGTCAEYDWGALDARPVREDAACAPRTGYGLSKHRCRLRLEALARDRGKEAAWGRVFFLFGAGEAPTRLVPAMIAASLAGSSMDCGPGGLVRDFWHARNVGGAFAALALSAASGPVNVGSGQPTRLCDIAAMIEAMTGTGGLIRFGQRPRAPGEPDCLVADTTRLRNEVGYREELSLDSGLRDYVETCRRKIAEPDA